MPELTKDEIFALRYAKILMLAKRHQESTSPIMRDYLDNNLTHLVKVFDKLGISEK